MLRSCLFAIAVLVFLVASIVDRASRNESRWAETTGMSSPRPSGGD